MEKIFLLLILLTDSNFVIAAGFDCTKASNTVEKLVCSDEKLSQLDDELTDVYKQAIKNSPNLKKEQINWLKTVRKCKDVGCITNLYNSRLLELGSLVETISDESNELDNESEKLVKAATQNSAVIKNTSPASPTTFNVELKDSMEEAKAEIIRQQQKQEEKEKILLEKDKALEKERADFEKLKSTNETVLSQKNENIVSEQQSSNSSTKTEVIGKPSLVQSENVESSTTSASKADAEAAAKKAADELAAAKDKADTEAKADDSSTINSKNEEKQNTTIFIVITALIISGLIWNKFIRRRCPGCKSTKYILENKTELDRFRQAKEVSERTASGKTKTTHVQVTYAINQYDYKCDVCGTLWSEKRKEEK